MNSKKTNKQTVVEQPQAPLTQNVLSKQQQAAHDNATTQTKNDGSHIEQQRAARLSQHKSKALINQLETN